MTSENSFRVLNIWKPPQLTPWQQFRREPAKYLATYLYTHKRPRPPLETLSPHPVTVVCISDTHNTTPPVPDGDILLHAGDLTCRGTFDELQAQLTWLNTLPHKHKFVIAGNHDLLLDADFVNKYPSKISEGEGCARADLDWGDLIYLNNSSVKVEINGRELSVYGAPWTETFGHWAFQYPPIRQVWKDTIPEDTDILLTHGPPKGHLDQNGKGCPQLLQEIWRAKPKLVVYGHIHDGHGREDVWYDGLDWGYDGVLMGDRGLWAVMVMGLYWVGDRIRGGRAERNGTVLVNAAAVQGMLGKGSQPAEVIEL